MTSVLRWLAVFLGLALVAMPIMELWRATPLFQNSASHHNLSSADQLRQTPLAPEPFLNAALDERTSPEVAMRLVNEGLRRSPRSVALQQRRLALAAETSDYESVVKALDRLFELDPDNRPAYLNVMVELSRLADGRKRLIDHLSASPPWAGQLINTLRAENADPDFMFEAAKASGSAEGAVLQRLLADKDYERAFIAWLGLSPLNDEAFKGWPHNPTFEDRKGLQPFDWGLGPLTDFEAPAGLRAVFKGRDRPTLARQVMLLEPGRYRFWARAKGKIKSRGGRFSWEITCLDQVKPVQTRLMIESLEDQFEEQAMIFDVPAADCPVQQLSLRGEAGEFPFTAWIEVEEVGIEPAALSEAAP